MKVGIVGKPNVGKSTLFAATTLAEAAIGNYPFTTIQPNHGVGYVRVPDPGVEMGVRSTPRTGKVVGPTRYVPVELVDVAGLVPGAHEGRGMGNKFLNDLSQADALVHVVDASGGTDAEGNVVPGGGHDPLSDVRFLEDELDWWIEGILADGWDRLAKRSTMEGRKLEQAIADRLQGIGINEVAALKALRETGLVGTKATDVPPAGLLALARAIRRASKPMVIALNKADVDPKRADAVGAQVGGLCVKMSAQSELALMKAAKAGVVEYNPGERGFKVLGTPSPAQQKGLDYIRSHVLEPLGQTGTNQALEAAVFGLLGRIPVFPVEDESRLTDKEDRVLPDCHLVPPGTTARQLAYKVHTDLGEHFIKAIDCRTKRAIGHDHVLKAGDVVKIHAKA